MSYILIFYVAHAMIATEFNSQAACEAAKTHVSSNEVPGFRKGVAWCVAKGPQNGFKSTLEQIINEL